MPSGLQEANNGFASHQKWLETRRNETMKREYRISYTNEQIDINYRIQYV